MTDKLYRILGAKVLVEGVINVYARSPDHALSKAWSGDWDSMDHDKETVLSLGKENLVSPRLPCHCKCDCVQLLEKELRKACASIEQLKIEMERKK